MVGSDKVDIYGRSRGIFYGTMHAFIWKNRGNYEKRSPLSHFQDRDLNSSPPEYEAGVLSLSRGCIFTVRSCDAGTWIWCPFLSVGSTCRKRLFIIRLSSLALNYWREVPGFIHLCCWIRCLPWLLLPLGLCCCLEAVVCTCRKISPSFDNRCKYALLAVSQPRYGEGGEAIAHWASCTPLPFPSSHLLLPWRSLGSQVFCVQCNLVIALWNDRIRLIAMAGSFMYSLSQKTALWTITATSSCSLWCRKRNTIVRTRKRFMNDTCSWAWIQLHIHCLSHN
jgi:hypothetical protein